MALLDGTGTVHDTPIPCPRGSSPEPGGAAPSRVVCAAFQGRGCVSTQTFSLAEPRILTVWPLTESVCPSLIYCKLLKKNCDSLFFPI